MKTPVQTLNPTMPIGVACRLMTWAGWRHMPILEEGDLVGMVSEHDILRAVSSDQDQAPLSSIMTSPPHWVGPDASVAEACEHMVARKISALPVLDQGHLIGLITSTDVLADRVRSDLWTAPSGDLPAARDVMSQEPISVQEDSRLLEAVSRMAGSGVRHLPVVDPAGRPVGMLSDRDLRSVVGDPLSALRDPEVRRKHRDRPVREVMAEPVLTVQVDEPIVSLITTFADWRVGALPVVDAEGQLVGVVSYIDIMRWLAGR